MASLYNSFPPHRQFNKIWEVPITLCMHCFNVGCIEISYLHVAEGLRTRVVYIADQQIFELTPPKLENTVKCY